MRPTTASTAAGRLFAHAADMFKVGSASAGASASTSRRWASSSASSTSNYPFNPTALSLPSTVPPSSGSSSAPPPSLATPKRGWSLITHLSHSHVLQNPSPYASLFSRRHPQRLRTGSVLTVLSYTDPTRKSLSPFSGVLMGVYRSQNPLETSFKLRNIVNKSGVEMKFKLFSPMIKEIKVVKRAEGRTGAVKDLRRAKVTYLRERPSIMAGIAGALKAAKR